MHKRIIKDSFGFWLAPGQVGAVVIRAVIVNCQMRTQIKRKKKKTIWEYAWLHGIRSVLKVMWPCQQRVKLQSSICTLKRRATVRSVWSTDSMAQLSVVSGSVGLITLQNPPVNALRWENWCCFYRCDLVGRPTLCYMLGAFYKCIRA